MMYSEKMAMAVKVGGKVLREFGEKVYVPFGAEYSLYFKNLNTVRAVVTISIDGEDIGGGQGFVVEPNSTLDIERFVRGNNSQGNRFKFIERTSDVENHRGIDVEDGLIRVEYQFAKPPLVYQPMYRGDASHVMRGARRISKGVSDSYGPMGMSASVASYSAEVPTSATLTSTSATPQNETGITVEGSISDQQFHTVSSVPMEDAKHVMVIKLVGETEDNRAVREPVTVKTKPTCKSCGTVNKYDAKFCSNCGTSLQIVA